jgi:hypothetical protein
LNVPASQARCARTAAGQLDVDDILRSPVKQNSRWNSQGDRFRSANSSTNDLLASSTEEFISEFKGSLASLDSGHRSCESLTRSVSQQDLNMPPTPIDFESVRRGH